MPTRPLPLLATLALLPACQFIPARPQIGGLPIAQLHQVELQLPTQQAGATPQPVTTWHEARLTIGRHDGTLSPVAYAFITRAGREAEGAQGVGRFPALPARAGYWLRVELIAKEPSGKEWIVGRGVLGDEDAAGVMLNPGGNQAVVPIAPLDLTRTLAAVPAVPPPRPTPIPTPYRPWSPSPTPSGTPDPEAFGKAMAGLGELLSALAPKPTARPAGTPEPHYGFSASSSSRSKETPKPTPTPLFIGDPDSGMALTIRNRN